MQSSKIFFATLIVALTAQCTTSFSFSIPFFDHNTHIQKPHTITPHKIPATEIERLTKAVDAIQRYYIASPDDKTLMNNAINGMVTRLDPHSAFLDKQELAELESTVSGEFVGIGVELTTEHGMLKVITPIADSPAQKAGLKPGDLIIKVDNKLIRDMSVNEAISHIKGKPNTPVTLTVLRKDETKPLVITVMREIVKIHAVRSKLLLPGYGYIRLSTFQESAAKQIKNDIEKLKTESGGRLKGLVLDLRNNPGGLLDASADVINLFLDKNTTDRYHNLIVYTKGRITSDDVSFTARDNNDIIPHVPIVVLINGGSASASEIVAGALQDYKRAIIMGSRSFGKGSVQTVIPIDANSALKLTTALYYTPSGREIQARGIEPDVIVPELSVNEKKMTSLLDLDEANYERHIENHEKNADENQAQNTKKHDQQQTELKLAKDDYQLYAALMMLKGAYAMQ